MQIGSRWNRGERGPKCQWEAHHRRPRIERRALVARRNDVDPFEPREQAPQRLRHLGHHRRPGRQQGQIATEILLELLNKRKDDPEITAFNKITLESKLAIHKQM